MANFTNPQGRQPKEPMRASEFSARPRYQRVGGWLLVICLMLTVVGPLITAGLMVDQYMSLVPYFASFRGLQVAIYLSIMIETGSVAFGIYAGLRLWSIRPGAVNTAKRALLLGLAANIVTATIQYAAGPIPAADAPLLYEITINLIPDLVFFTAAFAYLNISTRVHLTYHL